MAWMILAYALSGGLAFLILCKAWHLGGFDVSRGDAAYFAGISLLGPLALVISLLFFATNWFDQKIEFCSDKPFWRKPK